MQSSGSASDGSSSKMLALYILLVCSISLSAASFTITHRQGEERE